MVRQALGNCSMRCPTSCIPDTEGQALRAVDHERLKLAQLNDIEGLIGFN